MSLQEIEYRIETMINYLKMKVDEKDWHAVSDAANDLRELVAKKSMLPLNPTIFVPSGQTVQTGPNQCVSHWEIKK
jgi:hypothetical protein